MSVMVFNTRRNTLTETLEAVKRQLEFGPVKLKKVGGGFTLPVETYDQAKALLTAIYAAEEEEEDEKGSVAVGDAVWFGVGDSNHARDTQSGWA